MGTICLDYENVLGEVKRLNAIVTELQDLQSGAQKALNDMNVYWEGAAANAFTEAGELWRKEIKSLESEISSLAILIQEVADEIRDAELRAEAAIKAAELLGTGMNFFGGGGKND